MSNSLLHRSGARGQFDRVCELGNPAGTRVGPRSWGSITAIPAFYPGLVNLAWVGLAICCIPWFLRWSVDGYFSRQTAFNLPITLFLASAGLGVMQAQFAQYSLARFWLLVGCAATFYAIVNNPSRHWLRVFMLVTVILGVGVTTFLMLQVTDITEYPRYAGLASVGMPVLQWLSSFPKLQASRFVVLAHYAYRYSCNLYGNSSHPMFVALL